MSKLDIKGQVFHMPGTWGAHVPVVNASVEVIDVDIPGNKDDVILKTSTNPNGVFDGRSSEWRDTLTVKEWVQDSWMPPKGHWEDRQVPDPSDVMILKVRIKQGGNDTVVPFSFAGDGVMSPPVIVPWGPPVITVARVNGVEVKSDNPGKLSSLMADAINHGASPIKVELYGPDASKLMPLTLPTEQLRAWVNSRRAGAPLQKSAAGAAVGGAAITGTDIALILAAIGLICLMVGASVLLMRFGSAIQDAVAKGYSKIRAKQTTSKDGQVGVEMELER